MMLSRLSLLVMLSSASCSAIMLRQAAGQGSSAIMLRLAAGQGSSAIMLRQAAGQGSSAIMQRLAVALSCYGRQQGAVGRAGSRGQ